jgi:hypothetical protein
VAIQIQGYGGVTADVDGSTFRAIRITPRPIDYGSLGFYRLGMITGTMAAALTANSEIFQFRWTDATRFAAIYRIAISAGANVAATAAALVAFRLALARAWTVAGSSGTRATTTGHNQKLRTSMGTSLVAANDIGISTTGALTPGTKTIDAQDAGVIAFGIGTGAITTSNNLTFLVPTDLLNIDSSSDHPIVLAGGANPEGYVIRIGGNAFPAAMTWHASVNTSWAEVAAY